MTDRASGNVAGMAMRDRWSWLLARLALAMLLASLLFGLLLPVYTDEIGWRFQERAAFDGGLDIMFNDMCGPNTLAHAPWFMMPVRWFSAIANQLLASPLLVRATGVACVLGWIALLWRLTARLELERARRDQMRALAFALLGLGVLPLLLVMSRPEQPIILTVTLMILATIMPLPMLGPGPRVAAWLRVTAILLLALVAVSYHLKGVLYCGIAFACLLGCAKGRETWLARLIGMALLIALTAAAAHYWIARFQCPGDPILAEKLSVENVAAILSQRQDLALLTGQLLDGLNPLNYVELIVPIPNMQSHWLEHDLFSARLADWYRVPLFELWAIAGLFALVSLGRFIRTERLGALREPRLLIAAAILACTSLWGASQLHRNPYEASHMLPLLVLAILLCLSLPRRDKLASRGLLRLFVTAAVPIACLSQIILLGTVAGPLIAAAQTPAYLDRQPYSVSIAGYGGVRRDIARAMADAGIPHNRRLHRLLIDDVTYLALQGSELPLHRLGVLEMWRGSITDPVAYLRSRGSDGAVVGCRYLPADMRAVAAHSGQICAISRAGLDRLALRR